MMPKIATETNKNGKKYVKLRKEEQYSNALTEKNYIKIST